jgi:hypothetical protein
VAPHSSDSVLRSDLFSLQTNYRMGEAMKELDLDEGLNLTPEDEFHDIFPGSGAVGDAWEKWKAAHQCPEQFALEAV